MSKELLQHLFIVFNGARYSLHNLLHFILCFELITRQDVFNLSSTNVAGNDLVTQSVGAKYKPNGNTELGIAYEFPLTSFKDIIDSRLQVELILRY